MEDQLRSWQTLLFDLRKSAKSHGHSTAAISPTRRAAVGQWHRQPGGSPAAQQPVFFTPLPSTSPEHTTTLVGPTPPDAWHSILRTLRSPILSASTALPLSPQGSSKSSPTRRLVHASTPRGLGSPSAAAVEPGSGAAAAAVAAAAAADAAASRLATRLDDLCAASDTLRRSLPVCSGSASGSGSVGRRKQLLAQQQRASAPNSPLVRKLFETPRQQQGVGGLGTRTLAALAPPHSPSAHSQLQQSVSPQQQQQQQHVQQVQQLQQLQQQQVQQQGSTGNSTQEQVLSRMVAEVQQLLLGEYTAAASAQLASPQAHPVAAQLAARLSVLASRLADVLNPQQRQQRQQQQEQEEKQQQQEQEEKQQQERQQQQAEKQKQQLGEQQGAGAVAATPPPALPRPRTPGISAAEAAAGLTTPQLAASAAAVTHVSEAWREEALAAHERWKRLLQEWSTADVLLEDGQASMLPAGIPASTASAVSPQCAGAAGMPGIAPAAPAAAAFTATATTTDSAGNKCSSSAGTYGSGGSDAHLAAVVAGLRDVQERLRALRDFGPSPPPRVAGTTGGTHTPPGVGGVALVGKSSSSNGSSSLEQAAHALRLAVRARRGGSAPPSFLNNNNSSSSSTPPPSKHGPAAAALGSSSSSSANVPGVFIGAATATSSVCSLLRARLQASRAALTALAEPSDGPAVSASLKNKTDWLSSAPAPPLAAGASTGTGSTISAGLAALHASPTVQATAKDNSAAATRRSPPPPVAVLQSWVRHGSPKRQLGVLGVGASRLAS